MSRKSKEIPQPTLTPPLPGGVTRRELLTYGGVGTTLLAMLAVARVLGVDKRIKEVGTDPNVHLSLEFLKEIQSVDPNAATRIKVEASTTATKKNFNIGEQKFRIAQSLTIEREVDVESIVQLYQWAYSFMGRRSETYQIPFAIGSTLYQAAVTPHRRPLSIKPIDLLLLSKISDFGSAAITPDGSWGLTFLAKSGGNIQSLVFVGETKEPTELSPHIALATEVMQACSEITTQIPANAAQNLRRLNIIYDDVGRETWANSVGLSLISRSRAIPYSEYKVDVEQKPFVIGPVQIGGIVLSETEYNAINPNLLRTIFGLSEAEFMALATNIEAQSETFHKVFLPL